MPAQVECVGVIGRSLERAVDKGQRGLELTHAGEDQRQARQRAVAQQRILIDQLLQLIVRLLELTGVDQHRGLPQLRGTGIGPGPDLLEGRQRANHVAGRIQRATTQIGWLPGQAAVVSDDADGQTAAQDRAPNACLDFVVLHAAKGLLGALRGAQRVTAATTDAVELGQRAVSPSVGRRQARRFLKVGCGFDP